MPGRDMDLVRDLLIEIEDRAYNYKPFEIKLEVYPQEELQLHLALLQEAGLIHAVDEGNKPSGPRWHPVRLTWDGYDFLESAKDESRWNKAKAILTDKAAGFTYEIVRDLLKQLIRESVLDR